ncbi:MAG: hypothetical protein GWN87_02425 [Desulfuromonadales bacterium]|nr:hypothetical protein [Desulfuromonadales bacterium]NIS42610.1 hypothetical protein [Desulfuromonadales bacterium]
MFFIPLNQAESVELVIHALRMAGGEADCSSCPARKVCMKQCLTIAEAVQSMLEDSTLPELGIGDSDTDAGDPAGEAAPAAPQAEDDKNDRGRHLKIIK